MCVQQPRLYKAYQVCVPQQPSLYKAYQYLYTATQILLSIPIYVYKIWDYKSCQIYVYYSNLVFTKHTNICIQQPRFYQAYQYMYTRSEILQIMPNMSTTAT